MRTTQPGAVTQATRELAQADAAFRTSYPGDAGRRQPVHTFDGGAHLFKAKASERLGALARQALDDYAPEAGTFTTALGLPASEPADPAVPETT